MKIWRNYIFDFRVAGWDTKQPESLFFWEWPGARCTWFLLQSREKKIPFTRISPPILTHCNPPPYPLAAPNIHCSIARLRGSVLRVVRVILSHYLAFYVNWKDIVAKKKIIVRINIKNNSSWQQKACSHQHFRVLNEFIIRTKNGEVDVFVRTSLLTISSLLTRAEIWICSLLALIWI